MKTEIIKQITVKLEKDDKELLEKTVSLIHGLLNIGIKYNCDSYYMDGFYRDKEEFEDFIDFLNNLTYADNIELT